MNVIFYKILIGTDGISLFLLLKIKMVFCVVLFSYTHGRLDTWLCLKNRWGKGK